MNRQGVFSLSIMFVICCCVLVAGTILAEDAASPAAVGVIEELSGRAKATSSSGEVRKLSKEDDVFVGDKINTGRGSKVKLKFKDNSTISIGAKATLTIDEFVYKPGDAKSKCKSSLTRGIFKITGGEISKIAPDQAGIKTPVAYIGIRGTECVGEANSKKAIAIYTEGNAISVTNEHGQTILTGEAGMGCETKFGEAPGKPRKYTLDEINSYTRNISFGMIRGVQNVGAGAGARAGALGGMMRH